MEACEVLYSASASKHAVVILAVKYAVAAIAQTTETFLAFGRKLIITKIQTSTYAARIAKYDSQILRTRYGVEVSTQGAHHRATPLPAPSHHSHTAQNRLAAPTPHSKRARKSTSSYFPNDQQRPRTNETATPPPFRTKPRGMHISNSLSLPTLADFRFA